MAHFILKEMNEEDRLFSLDKPVITVGRSEDNNIVLDDINISRHHLQVVAKEGQFHLKDLASTNGTYLNGKRISIPRVMENLDIITLGKYSLCLIVEKLAPSDYNSSSKMDTLFKTAFRAKMPPCYLVIDYPPDLQQKFRIDQPKIVIGRDQECNLVVRDYTCAKRHAQVIYTGKEFRIQDMGLNGIIVNGIPCKEYVLQDKDTVQLGKIKLSFKKEAVVEAPVEALNSPAFPPSSRIVPEFVQRMERSPAIVEAGKFKEKSAEKITPESLGKPQIISVDLPTQRIRKANIPTKKKRDTSPPDVLPAKPVKPPKFAFVAGKDSATFHYSNCHLVKNILKKKRVTFESSTAAMASGRHPCGICKPGMSAKDAKVWLKKLVEDVESLKLQAVQMAHVLDTKGLSETDTH